MYNIGDLITFSYPAVHQQGTRAHDKYPQVLVLHNNWRGLVHGLNFNYLTDDEINTVRMFIDPAFAMQHRDNLKRKNPAQSAEFERIVATIQINDITSPGMFYEQVVKPFIVIRGWDPYRLYRPEKMTGVRILQPMRHMTGQDKPGLFQQFRNKFNFLRGPRLPTFGGPKR